IDKQTGTFITDEFRVFPDIQSTYLTRIEAVGDDGFYINGTNSAQEDFSVFVDLSEALDLPQAPVEISGLATDAEIAAAISIDDTTDELGVFELGDVDVSHAQWGTAVNANDTVYGSRWDDSLLGGNKDQTFITFGGSDVIDGAGGSDTLVVDANYDDVAFEKRELEPAGTVSVLDGVVGLHTNASDLIWTSPDDPSVSLVLNETKPTDNWGNPSSVNGHQFVSLADGNLAVVWSAAILKTINGNTDGIQDIYARILNPVTGEFVTDEIQVTDAQTNQSIGSLEATSGGSFVINPYTGPMWSTNSQAMVIEPAGTVSVLDGVVGLHTNASDLIWTSPDDPSVSLVLNETKPTDNWGNPSSVNGHQFVSLADGNLAVVWSAAILKTINGNTDGIQDIYARILNPVTGEFVTDEIQVTDAQTNQSIGSLEATSGGSFVINPYTGPMWSTNSQAMRVNLASDDALIIRDPYGSFEYEISDIEFVAFNDQTLSLAELWEPFSQKTPSIDLISSNLTADENITSAFVDNKLTGFSLNTGENQDISRVELEIYFSDASSGNVLPFEFKFPNGLPEGVTLSKTGMSKYKILIVPGERDFNAVITEVFDQFSYSIPEDLAGGVTGHLSVRNKNATNDWSDWKPSEFELSISPIAEVPLAEIEALSDLNHDGNADNHPNFYVNKDVLLKFNLKSVDVDGSEEINSVLLSGLTDANGLQKGSIVDIAGNIVGTVNNSGEVEFSPNEIQKYILATDNKPNVGSSTIKTGLGLDPTNNVVGELDYTTVHSYGGTGDSVSGKPGLIIYESSNNQPTVIFTKVQINSPLENSSSFGRVEAFGHFHNPDKNDVQYIDINYKRPDGFTGYKQIRHDEIDPNGGFKLELAYEGDSQLGSWELLSTTITFVDNTVNQTNFSNDTESKTFEVIDARPYDGNGMGPAIGTNQSLPTNIVTFENAYFSKPDGINFLNIEENTQNWGSYYADVKSYWDS
ncbi:hypothetical protein N9M78_06365, partial [Alphaproteobacteria bacterium]|nr:hypothetical protein [Alphaproteobacteria bacterium]